MTKQEIQQYIQIEKLLRKAISDDYTGDILRIIFDDVIEDIKTTADVNYNEDDIKLALGRVLLDRLENIGE